MQVSVKQNQPRSAVEGLIDLIRRMGYELVRMENHNGWQVMTCMPNRKDNPNYINSVVLRQVVGSRN